MYSSFQCRVAGEEGPVVSSSASVGSGTVPGGVTNTTGSTGTGGTGDGLPFRRGIRLLETGCVDNVLQVGKCRFNRPEHVESYIRNICFTFPANEVS